MGNGNAGNFLSTLNHFHKYCLNISVYNLVFLIKKSNDFITKRATIYIYTKVQNIFMFHQTKQKLFYKFSNLLFTKKKSDKKKTLNSYFVGCRVVK